MVVGRNVRNLPVNDEVKASTKYEHLGTILTNTASCEHGIKKTTCARKN